MKDKKKSTIFKVLIVLFWINCVYFFVMYSNILHTEPDIIWKDNFMVKQGEKVKNTSFIKEVRFGKIISKESYVNTSTVGKKYVKIVIKNIYGKTKSYEFHITVIPNE